MTEAARGRIAGGLAGPSGFRIWIEPGPGTVDLLKVGPGGPVLKRLQGARVIGFVPLMLLAMLLLAPSLGWERSLQLPLLFIAGFFLAASSAQIFGISSWHALEHKSIHVLDRFFSGEAFGSIEAVQKAIKEAPPHHARCGSILISWLTYLLPLFSLALPTALAFAAAGVLAVLLYERGVALEEFGFPMQNLFLAEPSEEQVRTAATQLYAYMRVLEEERGREAGG